MKDDIGVEIIGYIEKLLIAIAISQNKEASI
jgi:hypothetical protein